MNLFSKRSTATTLEGLRKEWASCQSCPFYTQRKHVVMGVGEVGATIFAVGQAPAEDEDVTGVPFAGKGGAATKQQFELVGIPLAEVFWTNVLACKPFGWMQGVRKEFAKNCHDRLEAELLIVKPKMIVAMGTPAGERFLPPGSRKRKQGTQGSGEMRGRRFTYRGLPGLTVLHPAAILRQRNMDKRRARSVKQDIAEDMERVKALYEHVRRGP